MLSMYVHVCKWDIVRIQSSLEGRCPQQISMSRFLMVAELPRWTKKYDE